MKKRQRWMTMLLGLALLATALSGALAEAADVTYAQASEPLQVQLGASGFLVTLPAGYQEGPVTEQEQEDGQIAYYYSDDNLLDLDIYQCAKDDPAQGLAEYAAQEAEEYLGATELVTDKEINGIPVAWYRTVEAYNGTDYDTVTYIMDGGDDYIEIVFWLDGENAEADCLAIIQTLRLFEAN